MDELMDAIFDFIGRGFYPELLVISVLSIVAGLIIEAITLSILRLYSKKTNSVLTASIAARLKGPLSWFIPLLLIIVFTQTLLGDYPEYHSIKQAFDTVFYAVCGWLVVKLVYIFTDVILNRFAIDNADNLQERKIVTQIQFIRKIVIIGVSVIFAAIILLSFEGVRKLGAGLLTSAGIMGIIMGFAAQKSISNLLAGLQLAFSQPVRIDDVVIVEGEWGRIEEITLTYVVVRIWDLRRLIIPLNYFIERPFQNWTRTSADILASVFIHADYRLPVDAVRNELTRLLEQTDLWDKKVNVTQVTKCTEKTIEIRALVSAGTSGEAWDLQCYVRENLVKFIATEYPEYLPLTRIEPAQALKNFEKA